MKNRTWISARLIEDGYWVWYGDHKPEWGKDDGGMMVDFVTLRHMLWPLIRDVSPSYPGTGPR